MISCVETFRMQYWCICEETNLWYRQLLKPSFWSNKRWLFHSDRHLQYTSNNNFSFLLINLLETLSLLSRLLWRQFINLSLMSSSVIFLPSPSNLFLVAPGKFSTSASYSKTASIKVDTVTYQIENNVFVLNVNASEWIGIVLGFVPQRSKLGPMRAFNRFIQRYVDVSTVCIIL